MISRKYACHLLFLTFFIVLTGASVSAAWEIQPIIEARVGYSDNFGLDGDDQESGFVTQVNPGISATKSTGRLLVDLDYTMRNFYYFDEDELNTDHDLDAIARYAVIPNKLFINSFAQMTQVLVDNDQQISFDNINNTGNTTDEYSYGIGPQFIQQFGSHALANISYLYSEQRFEDETADDADEEGDIDDNNQQTFSARLSNVDRQSERFDWGVSYEREKVDFDVGESVKFTTRKIDAGLELTPNLELVGAYGYEENDFGDDVVIDDDDGSFWSAGLIAGFGEFTTLEVRRADRFFGEFWLGQLSIAGPKLSVLGSYEERADLSGINDVDIDFDPTPDLLDQLELLDNEVNSSPDDRNSVSVIKVWTLDLAYTKGKSTILGRFTNEDEEFLDSGNKEKSEEYTLGYIWQMTGISSLSIIAEFSEDKSEDGSDDSKSDLFEIDVTYQKQLSPKTDFDVIYTYSEGESDEFDDDFTANTILAGVVHRF